MTQYPLNALKRKLEDDSISLPKRLRLAKNVVNSQHFPMAPKQRIVGEWFDALTQSNKLTSKELRDLLTWINNVDSLTNELRTKLIKVVSQYLHNVPLKNDDIPYIISFIENNNISPQLSSQIDELLFITVNLLQHLYDNDQNSTLWINRIFNSIIKYYKESKKKLEFIVKFLDGETLETVFSYLHTQHYDTVINLCQNILFPSTKKSIFYSFLTNLIRKDNIKDLIAEKGENIQSVLKIMSTLFTFPKGRTTKEEKFIFDFVEVFVTCFKMESQLIFAFYIMATNFFNMTQSYLNPAMKMPPIIFEENNDKLKRNLFLAMLEILLKNDIDIGVNLTDTVGDISKVEVKKNFMSFLQAVTMGILKLEGKIDKTSLQIIKAGLKLDPSLIEQKIDQILPHIMTVKKNNTNITSVYIETVNFLLEILFKLSRGIDFVNKIIPHIKLSLEASNVNQFDLRQKLNESIDGENEKLTNKIINGNDVLPTECVEMYGRLTSELMFRQNKDLLISLQKDLEENCLMMLEEGFVSPSIITLTEVLSSILSSFLRHSKMADHTVPVNIAQDFWSTYQKFENECLRKFGECILKLNYNPPLIEAFLKVCLSFSQLKLLNIKYSNTKLTLEEVNHTMDISDISVILPCLDSEQWTTIASKIQEKSTHLLWDHLLLTKIMAIEMQSQTNEDTCETLAITKTYLIQRISNYNDVFESYYFIKGLFANMDKNQLKILSKTLIKQNPNPDMFKSKAICDNKNLLQALVLETSKSIIKSIENCNLTRPINKYINDITSLGKENNIKVLIDNIHVKHETEILNHVGILQNLQIQYLDENYQLIAVFVLLMVKKCCNTKKQKRSTDNILQAIFELSPKYPDIYKLLSVDDIFNFKDNTILDLLTSTNKSANNILAIKCILESATKRVKTDPEIIKDIVDILLKGHKIKNRDIESFNNPVFQISCLILPLIAKEKRAITTSAFRSILANLQEKLNKAMLKSFKNIDFNDINETSNTEESIGNETLATLNAMGAYTLTLLKCCETTDAKEIQSLDCLWSGLEFFINKAIQSIQNPNAKIQHIESSLQLINVTLRYIKKLETHTIFQDKDKLFQRMWSSIKSRLVLLYTQKGKSLNVLEEISVTLKFLAELSSVECFGMYFVGDLSTLAVLKKPSIILKNEDITNSELATRKVMKYLLIQCIKANIIAPKCVVLTKLIFRATKNFKCWIQQHYDIEEQTGSIQDGEVEEKILKIDDPICELLRNNLDILSEVILAAKKITLDYKFMDATFELLHLIHYIMGRKNSNIRCEVSWQAFFMLYEGYIGVLNNVLLSREELLEDRWPCYMQCYKALIQCLCERSVAQDTLDRDSLHKIAESGHTIEKLTQSICKRKAHVSRISAYAVADICTWIERNPPTKMIRQHLENSIALLIQVSDSTYAMAFLRRALAGSIGQMTMTNMYTMYKRYHKYVGNS